MERRLDSSGTDPATASEYDSVDFWIREIERLDRVLERPAISLIQLADEVVTKGIDIGGKTTLRTIPTTIDNEPRMGESLLIHVVASSAIQRLNLQRRRFPWLRDYYGALDRLHEVLPTALVNQPALQAKDPLERLNALSDEPFGTLSPLTVAEVFWLLVRAGENYAHGDLGFLALFGLLWALQRNTHGPFDRGASLGFWRPTVAVTARCLLPILTLTDIVRRRAKLWRSARDSCEVIEKNAAGRNQLQRWRFASEIDRLAGTLHALAAISIKPSDFHDAADVLTSIASPLGPRSATAPLIANVRQAIRELLGSLRDQNASILSKAEEATHVVQKALLDALKKEGKREKVAESLKLVPDWNAQLKAAEAAHQTCEAALAELKTAVTLCETLPTGADFTHRLMIDALNRLATINDRVNEILTAGIQENLEWCSRGVTREVAFASAKNDTDFDAAELLSGIIIGERTKRLSRMAAEDAIRLSLRAAREDGSWWSGQPIFLEKRTLGVWPSTADVLLLLSTAVKGFDDLETADQHLLRFVDWLEGRMILRSPRWWKSEEPLAGWTSEAREPWIDVWTTATAVKALIEIREILEARLWSICKRRFIVLDDVQGLTKIDPVDLGARHEIRLQTRMLRNAARANLDEEDAEYSYILHGPPGSSKSVLAQAIGREMWHHDGEVRFVRITPADFTRRGESGIDVEARFIFRLLSHIRGATILFDEIDDFLRLREVGAEPAFIRLIIPGMLNRLQDLHDASSRQEICFLLGVNYIDQIEPALTRPGRIDAPIPVPYPDAWSRESILERIAGEVPADVKEYAISNTGEWPWSTFRKLCKGLKERPTQDNATDLISELRLDFQSTDYYYQNPKRWKTSSPLVNEFIHVAFATSKDPEECRQRVRSLIKHLEKDDTVRLDDIKLLDKFENEWRREGRL